MPSVELPLSGPAFQRATTLAREAVTSIAHGGPAADGALEFVLTEAANNPTVGATLMLLLAQMAATLARLAAELEEGPSDAPSVLQRTVDLVDEIASALSSVDPG